MVSDAVQQNIPTGVVRYRDPYENVDIDVERTPNASTNQLTLEDGSLLLFEVEDENRDGVITADETVMTLCLEESPLNCLIISLLLNLTLRSILKLKLSLNLRMLL